MYHSLLVQCFALLSPVFAYMDGIFFGGYIQFEMKQYMVSFAQGAGSEVGAVLCTVIVADEGTLFNNLIFFFFQIVIDLVPDLKGERRTKGFQGLSSGTGEAVI